jgi:DNA-binding Xre family transcriptional regulator
MMTGPAAGRLKGGLLPMKWNLRLAAAHRGIWKASELQRMLADAGLVISAGKMSGLWSGHPASIKLDDLDVLCAVVGCGVEELLIAEPAKITRPAGDQPGQQPGASSRPRPVTPRRRDGRSLPPA